MKILEKITLIIYANIILILSIILCLLVFGWLDINLVGNLIKTAIVGDLSSKIILGVSVIFILLSIKCIFFDIGIKKERDGEGVLLENTNGKLLISKETLENLVNSVAKGFDSTQEISTRVELGENNNVNVYANLIVSSNAIIKDLSVNLQTKIKEKIKSATDLDVKEVNIKIKNVAPKEEIENS